MKQLLSSVAMLALAAGLAHAQTPDVPDNLEKLSNFQTTGTTKFTMIEQGGDYAEGGGKKNLERIKLPPGFKIGLYAIVPDAHHMAVGAQGIVTFVGTRKDKVWRSRPQQGSCGRRGEGLRTFADLRDSERPSLLR
ncbi:hypothetical protein ABID21_000327 [Pseudorhizobium tarimense]|uniref:Uncharacterized protein n=1 Tax=Pseudorhizobium tarimense TaxID=1079109 RepID=A0ABV2H119_9HYPH